MIEFNFEIDFTLNNPLTHKEWIDKVILSEECLTGEINYIFCDDEYLYNINTEFLDHDTYTDIISFDYTEGNIISGDIFISVDRVKENALTYQTSFENELRRVMIHGILHYCGYKDKSTEESQLMREKEDEKLLLFHVEQN
ncbi:rRNA maturation RNase YbeY [Robertkochia solimangrovi]|uniref:rRNA maturation RNase YbeY n=1 Tax=Robertkochia solimangrovi TaxID=2213046 RepID=UPI00118055E2|nr:rRNA maturation RNase YbeY [Robertkochia solimangrovi]TRZ46059.1 rRNA maturation RNase YbeY [Robertkochia solimangrovi]